MYFILHSLFTNLLCTCNTRNSTGLLDGPPYEHTVIVHRLKLLCQNSKRGFENFFKSSQNLFFTYISLLVPSFHHFSGPEIYFILWLYYPVNHTVPLNIFLFATHDVTPFVLYSNFFSPTPLLPSPSFSPILDLNIMTLTHKVFLLTRPNVCRTPTPTSVIHDLPHHHFLYLP